MTLLEAVDRRVSRRSYAPEPLNEADCAELKKIISETPGVRMELVAGDGSAFGGLRKSYGMFKGVTNYVVLVQNADDRESAEKLGYYGEKLVLQATAMGLGTCWVGGTFDKKSLAVKLSDKEAVCCVITIGRVEEKLGVMERFIRGVTHRKTKTAAEMSDTDATPPEWFINGVKAAQKAPSAINRQPVTFACKGGQVSASVKGGLDVSLALDLGIAKYHFALGAGGGAWEWGNGGKFNGEW